MAHSHSDHAEVSPTPVSQLLDLYRRRRDGLEQQQRELADLEHAILDAADRESQEILAAARRQVREILVQARRDLVVLVAQVQAARDHGAAIEPHRPQVVRAVLDPARPEIQALEAEATALRASLSPFPSESGDALLHIEGPGAPFEIEAGPALHDDISDGPPIHADTPGTTSTPSRAAGETPRSRAIVQAVPSSPGARRWRWALVLLVLLAIGFGATRSWKALPSSRADGKPAAPTTVPHTVIPAPADTPPVVKPSAALVLEARRPVWLRVRVDGSVDSGRIFSPGERRELNSDRVSVRAGDAGAVFVSVHGGPFEPLGPSGSPLTREFGTGQQPALPAAADAPEDAATPTSTTLEMPTALPDPGIAAREPTPAPPASQVPASPASAAVPTSLSSLQRDVPQSASGAENQVEGAAEAWFGAFFRHDVTGMRQAGGSGTIVDDQRSADEAPVPGVSVRRSFEDVKVQVAGTGAMYTGRLIESDLQGARYVSVVSQVWLRSGSTWQLINVRLMPENRLTVPSAADNATRPGRESRNR